MAKSNVAKSMVVDFLTRNQSVNQPTQLYLALYVTDPTDADIGTEVAYTGYQRLAVTFGPPQIENGYSVVRNTNLMEFAIVPEDSGVMAHAGLRTAASGGDLIYYGPLAATYQLLEGVQPVVSINALSVSES